MTLEVGSKVKGKVSGITNFGAFVDLPGDLRGLVHISEVSDRYVSEISEHLQIGEEVEVKILSMEDNGKIALSIRKAKDSERRPRSHDGRGGRARPSYNDQVSSESFDQKMSRFLKDSEDRLTSLKRSTDTKRGGRGGRRG